MSLNGLRVLNTRPADQGLQLSQAISEAGGLSIALPALIIEPTADDWLKKLPILEKIDQAIFISANAGNYFFAKLNGQSWPINIQNIAIGKASSTALSNWNVRIDHVPPISDSEHLLQLDSLQEVSDKTILLVKGEGGRPDIADTLRRRNAHLISLEVYRRVLPKTDQQLLHLLWHDDLVDIILFTSQQAIQNIVMLFAVNKYAHSWLCKTPCLVISNRLAEAAYIAGMQKIIVSNYDTILDTLEHYNKDRARSNISFWRPNQGQGHDNQ